MATGCTHAQSAATSRCSVAPLNLAKRQPECNTPNDNDRCEASRLSDRIVLDLRHRTFTAKLRLDDG